MLSSLPIMGDDVSGYMAAMMRMQNQQPKPAWGIIRQIKEMYKEVTTIAPDADEIKDIDLLLVIHPKDLPDKTRYAIDQYVLRGGRAVVALDPFSVVDRPNPAMAQYGVDRQAASAMPDLLRAWADNAGKHLCGRSCTGRHWRAIAESAAGEDSSLHEVDCRSELF